MSESLFDYPLVTGVANLLALCLYSAAGLLAVRRFLLPRMRITEADSEFTGSMMQSVLAVYGLAVALIAVTVFDTYSETTKIVTEEAAALNAFFRDVTSYPEPVRSDLQQRVRTYTRYVIDEAWPLQRRGQVPSGGIEHMTRIQSVLDTFEPATEGQKIMHGETLRSYNLLIHARRLRLDAVGTTLPAVMWLVILGGGFIGLTASFFFKVVDARLHLIEVLLLAAFIGILIMMIVTLDRPFRGNLAISAAPYELVYDQLMKGPL